MESRSVEIVNPTGLHTRPGTLFVKQAKTYSSEIHIVKNDKRVNAKSLLTLLKAGISLGDTITIEAEGPDAVAAVDDLANMITSLKD